jgi:hypothetical protein
MKLDLPHIGVRIELSSHLPPGRWSIIGRDGKPIPVVLGVDGRAIGPPVDPSRIDRVLCAPDVFDAVLRERARRARLADNSVDLKASRR